MREHVVGWAMIAGVQSTVWILAISAAMTSRALSKSSSSDQLGMRARAGRSQIALCSRMNSECSSARPTQKFPATPVRSMCASMSCGTSPLVVEPQLAVLARADGLRERWVATVDLRAVPPMRVVGDEGRWRTGVGAGVVPRALDRHRVLRPRIGVVEGDEPRVRASVLPWLNQSCTSNWIHAPASKLSVVAGLELLARE